MSVSVELRAVLDKTNRGEIALPAGELQKLSREESALLNDVLLYVSGRDISEVDQSFRGPLSLTADQVNKGRRLNVPDELKSEYDSRCTKSSGCSVMGGRRRSRRNRSKRRSRRNRRSNRRR